MLKTLHTLLLLLVFILTVIVSLPNLHSVVVYYYIGSIQISLALLLVLSFSLGVGIGISLSGVWLWKLSRENRRLKKLYK